MRASSIAFVLWLNVVALAAQLQPAAPVAHLSDLGFSYSLPSDWEVVNAAPTLSGVKEQAQQNASTEDEKKGVACVQIALTARHGAPATVLVIVELPFACFGQTMSSKDLPGFAQGASEGIKQSFDVTDPVYGDYVLGSHNMWIERAKGTPKGHPESSVHRGDRMHVAEEGRCLLDGVGSERGCTEDHRRRRRCAGRRQPDCAGSATAFEKKPAS
jgi:hypothetical protein